MRAAEGMTKNPKACNHRKFFKSLDEKEPSQQLRLLERVLCIHADQSDALAKLVALCFAGRTSNDREISTAVVTFLHEACDEN